MLTRLATLALLIPSAASAQDPTRDLPWRRFDTPVEARACVDLGLTRLAAGWDWEAARAFRGITTRDDDSALGHLLLALALRDHPNRAARLCWEAVSRIDGSDPDVAKVVRAYRSFFGVGERKPELFDPLYSVAPGRVARDALVRALDELAAESDLARRLRDIERGRSQPNVHVADDRVASTLASYHAYLDARGMMPYQIPGYLRLLKRDLGDDANRDVALARLPHHPMLAVDALPVGPLPGFDATASESWQPRTAPAFDLPRGLGGRGTLADHAGKPLLVVFFLGFG